MKRRQLIVVDVETTGTDPAQHVPIEVAAINLATGDELHFVPFLHPDNLAAADYDALRINRYFERGVFKQALPPAETRSRYEQLWEWPHDSRFGGANPRFDAEMLRHGYGRTSNSIGHGYQLPEEVWHYRLADLGSYAAGVLGIDLADVPSLDEVREALGLDACEPVHSALADARNAAACFKFLAERRHSLTFLEHRIAPGPARIEAGGGGCGPTRTEVGNDA